MTTLSTLLARRWSSTRLHHSPWSRPSNPSWRLCLRGTGAPTTALLSHNTQTSKACVSFNRQYYKRHSCNHILMHYLSWTNHLKQWTWEHQPQKSPRWSIFPLKYSGPKEESQLSVDLDYHSFSAKCQFKENCALKPVNCSVTSVSVKGSWRVPGCFLRWRMPLHLFAVPFKSDPEFRLHVCNEPNKMFVTMLYHQISTKHRWEGSAMLNQHYSGNVTLQKRTSTDVYIKYSNNNVECVMWCW